MTETNLKGWQEHGDHLLVVQPFMDTLIASGDGCHLIDVDGRRILDLAAGQFCSILGHSHPGFIARLREQLGTLLHLGDQYVSPGVLRAASRLAGVAPVDDGKCIFLSTGSEANECAMRMAKAYTGRTGMLGFTRGYYGISLATRNLSSISDHPGHVDFQPAPVGQHKLLTPIDHRCPVGLSHDRCNLVCLDASFETIGEQAGNLAAVIVEPVLSAGGMIFPSTEYMRALRDRVHRVGALFIVDEAQTGFGRCGRWFDIDNHDIRPDMLVVSKSGGNGYPLGAVVVSGQIAEKLEAQGFSHLSSHQNDPLAAATVQAVIDIVDEEKLADHSREVGDYFIGRLEALKEKHPLVRQVRGRGLMIGMELDADEPNVALRLGMLCEQRGVHVTFSYFEPVIRFIPPLVLTKADVDQAVAVLDECMHAIRAGEGDLAKLLPQNPRSGPYTARMTQGMTPLRMIRGMWNTAPKEWLGKLKRS